MFDDDPDDFVPYADRYTPVPPSENMDVHTEHCCKAHGCKYGDGDCPVATGAKQQSFPCEDCPPWSMQWPTKPGAYWLYGFRFKSDRKDFDGVIKPPALYYVEVWNSGNNRPTYVCGGSFLYKAEGGGGYWLKVRHPTLPVMPFTHLDIEDSKPKDK